MKHKRTTHSDLAELLEILAKRLGKVPEGFCVSDASTLRLLTDAANILREQDELIDGLRVALRSSVEEQRAALQRKTV